MGCGLGYAYESWGHCDCHHGVSKCMSGCVNGLGLQKTRKLLVLWYKEFPKPKLGIPGNRYWCLFILVRVDGVRSFLALLTSI